MHNFQVFFLNCNTHRLLVTLYSNPNSSSGQWVLHFPAFADEMNKSRQLVSECSRRIAESGSTVLVCDLYGTGDSEGDFSGATWEIWLSNMRCLVRWIIDQGGESIAFWGLRSGCLLAVDLFQSLLPQERKRINHLLFWQPLLQGKKYLSQFLRLRVAASLYSHKKQQVSDLINLLYQGKEIEVAGYTLNPDLFKQLESIKLEDYLPDERVSVSWIEIAARNDSGLLASSQAIVEHWKNNRVTVLAQSVPGMSFWNALEPELLPQLIDATMESMQSVFACQVERQNQFSNVPPHSHYQEDAILEKPVIFECQGEKLAGVIHSSSERASRGVLVVVGGPQYRVGSHRQFVLLARGLAEQNIPVFRFDYRGMGDSSGARRGFDRISDDIRAAIDCFQAKHPEINEIVIWGLCDAATAASSYADSDQRVKGLVLLNPWVRSDQGEAQVYLKKYYIERLLSQSFWLKALKGGLDLSASFTSLFNIIRKLKKTKDTQPIAHGNVLDKASMRSLSQQMEEGLTGFEGNVLIVLSGKDLVAAEFQQSVNSSKQFTELLNSQRFIIHSVLHADHTFSREIWRNEVSETCREWIRSW
ncbi:MAG: hydrolase 1, exosortase A system-associated [Sedimenticola sp.]|nr:hydrolase 1, exosortase A system-associated [Sedimenticola sp.]